MNFKWIFGVLAGYFAGMALATKYKKNTTAKTKGGDAPSSFMDDIVDIHKSAYSDVKHFVETNLEGVKTWEDFQARAQSIIDSFSDEFENMKEMIADKIENKDVILEKMKSAYEERLDMLESGKEKAVSMFTDMKEDVINKWIDTAKVSLENAYKKAQSFIEKL